MKVIDPNELSSRMYHEAFEKDSDMQKWEQGCWIRYKVFENCLADTPVIDAEEIRYGKWIEDYADENCRYVRCSRCDITQVFYYGKLNTNYCPNCGAKMGYKDETNRPNRG